MSRQSAGRRTGVPRWLTSLLGALLVVLCGLALHASLQIGAAARTAQSSVDLADRYQQARYLASSESAQLGNYLLTGDSTLRDQYENTTYALDSDLLGLLAALGSSPSAERTVLAHLIDLQTQYETDARAMFDLTARGRTTAAAAMEYRQLDPLNTTVATSLGGYTAAHHTSAVTDMASVAQQGRLLRAGTPIGLAAALAIVVLLAGVGRSHRRAIQRQALHDALTGLPTRRLFTDRACQAVATAQRTGAAPVVMVLDLDDFKEVNDTLGHHYGDQLLREVTARLAGALRPADTLARFGGDEFAALLPDGGAAAGARVAVRLREALDAPFDLDGISIGIEASIGIATMTDTEPDAAPPAPPQRVEQLLREADSAMYCAKAERLGFAHYSLDHDAGAPNRLAVLWELRQALDNDELVVHYQPKISADAGELVGVEALVRWDHPRRGLLPPSEFIALAESTTLIHRLTAVVVEKSLTVCRRWLEQGVSIPVSVNVSSRCLLDPGFRASITAQLERSGLEPQMLCLELTESAIMVDPDRAIAVLTALHSLGVRLSVDDFGTGYSSMAYLKILPVDELKVDRTFVTNMTANDGNTALVQSAVDLGHNLGLAVVAEGVEDNVTLVALRSVGADVIQGYYTGRPMSAEALEAWLPGTPVARG